MGNPLHQVLRLGAGAKDLFLEDTDWAPGPTRIFQGRDVDASLWAVTQRARENRAARHLATYPRSLPKLRGVHPGIGLTVPPTSEASLPERDPGGLLGCTRRNTLSPGGFHCPGRS